MPTRKNRLGDLQSPLSRREWLTLAAAGVSATTTSGWLERLAHASAQNPERRRSCILLWMTGGPSQIDTFDLKPGHENGGPFREIRTAANDIRISEHLPTVGRAMNDLAIIRSMSSREGDHGRATYYLRTGMLPQGAVQYPTFGSLISKELGRQDAALPNFVSIAPYRRFNQAAFGPGFLGSQYAPLIVGELQNPFQQNNNQGDDYSAALRVEDLTPTNGVTPAQMNSRVDILNAMENRFASRHPGETVHSHQTAYDRAIRLMRTTASTAFSLDEEPDNLRDEYGRNLFGQGCLLARRLVERGVPFVEVSLSSYGNRALGWDTHTNNFDSVRGLSGVLDAGWGTLMRDLRNRGLLESTTIVWMGEFGRTPRINQNQGRDHYPNAWTAVVGGGGIRGGQVHGATSADGTTVEAERPTSVPDLLATVCRALGIDPRQQNMSNVGRPIRLVEPTAQPIREVLA